jgi:hypothetical protein
MGIADSLHCFEYGTKGYNFYKLLSLVLDNILDNKELLFM